MKLNDLCRAIKRGSPPLELAIKAARRRRTVTREAAAQLVHIANCQFQLQAALSSDGACGPLLTCDGYPFQGLHDARLRIDEAIAHALNIRNENARAMVYSEIYLLPGLAASAIEKWETQLELSRSNGDADAVKRSLAWLNKPDNGAVSQVDKAFAFLEKPPHCTSPKRFDKQMLACLKP